MLTALALTLVLVTFPRLPLGTDDDSSWSAVMDYAHRAGLQFGTDIAFTYGPLGFLITPYYSPSSPWLRVVTDLALTLTVAGGFSLLVWRVARPWRWLSIGMLLFLGANADPRSELLIKLGLMCWTLLCLLESGARLRVCLMFLGGLAAFGILAKMTLLVPAALSLGAVSACFWIQRRARPALALPLGTGAVVLLAWVGLGQNLPHFGSFLLNSLTVSAAYDQAMWADPYPSIKWAGLAMLALTGSALWLCFKPGKISRGQKWQRVILLAWFTLLLGGAWKHGFVRADRDHFVVFFGFVPILALLLEVWPLEDRARRLWLRGLAAGCCLIAVLSVLWLFSWDARACLARPFRLAMAHGSSLLRPGVYQRELSDLQQAERQANQLPRLRAKIGRSSVDVLGRNQAYAIFNGLNFRPRPVFQSYAAYSAPLMSLNEQFYFSQRAPEYVLLSLNPIDDRLPTMEDAFVFRDLLINDQPLDAEGPFLLFKARQPVAPALTLLREGTLGVGDVIGLKEYGNANLWLAIDVKPNLAGQLGRWLYRPSELTLAVWCDTPTLRAARFHAPAPMLAAGFLASPLPLDNRDVLDLCTGKPITRPSAYSIEIGPAAQHLWQDGIHFRLYRIENQIGQSAPSELGGLLDFPGFGTAPQELVASRHAMLTVGGKPALYLAPGGFMKFAVPRGATRIEGSLGFAPAAYLLGGATEGAEFRIEEEQGDGNPRLLFSQTLRPGAREEDRGMKPFSVACASGGKRKLVLRVVPLGRTTTIRDLSCWADIRFK